MAYPDSAALVRTSAFQDQVQVAIVVQALIVLSTSPDTMADPGGLRLLLAHRVLLDSTIDLFRFAWATAANSSITSSSPDGDVLFTVAAVWSELAGIDPT